MQNHFYQEGPPNWTLAFQGLGTVMYRWGSLPSTAHCVVWQLALYKFILDKDQELKNESKLPPDNGELAL